MARNPALPPFECAYQGRLLAGVDEVGRGPLIGAVVTAAVILNPDRPIAGLADSKKLTEKKRNVLYEEIIEHATAWCLGRCEAHEIDQINIYQATMIAMERAVAGLGIAPEYVLVDGNKCPKWHWPSEPVVKGDSRVEAISAASILAKVTRDRPCPAQRLSYTRAHGSTVPVRCNARASEVIPAGSGSDGAGGILQGTGDTSSRRTSLPNRPL